MIKQIGDPCDFPGKNPGVGCHVLLQGIFLTEGSNPHLLCLLHCTAFLYLLSSRKPSTSLKCCNFSIKLSQIMPFIDLFIDNFLGRLTFQTSEFASMLVSFLILKELKKNIIVIKTSAGGYVTSASWVTLWNDPSILPSRGVAVSHEEERMYR